MRRCAANGIKTIRAHQQIIIRASIRERVITRQTKLGVVLPPTIRGADDFRVQGLIQLDAHPCAAMRRLKFDPIARLQSLRLSRLGRQFDAGM